MDIELPNGKVIQGVPDGTPKAEIMRKAIAAGYATEADFGQPTPPTPPQPDAEPQPDITPQPDTEPTQDTSVDVGSQRPDITQGGFSLPDMLTGRDRTTEQLEALPEIGGAPELNELSFGSFKTAAGLLATGDPSEMAEIVKSNFPEATFETDDKGNFIANLPSGQYALNKPGVSIGDVPRAITEALLFGKAGAAKGILKAGAASGAVEAGLQATKTSAGAELDLEDAIKDIGFSTVTGAGFKTAEEAISAGYRFIKGRWLNPSEAEQVIKFAKDNDLPLLTSDVRPPRQFTGKAAQATAEKIPVVGTGGVRAEQKEAREKVFTEYAESFGDYQPSVIVDSLKKKTTGIKRAAGNTISKVKDEIGGVRIPANDSIAQIDDAIANLSALGEVADTATIDALSKYRNELTKDNLDFNKLQQLRSQFRQDVKGERNIWPGRSEALVNKVYSQMTKDMDYVVSTALGPKEAAKWKRANTIYAEEANLIKNTRLKTALQKGELTPEVVNTMLYSAKPSEVKILYNSLGPRGKQAARTGVIVKAMDKAGGSPDKFLNELNRMSKSTGILFKGEERKQLEGLKKYLDYTRRAPQAAAAPATGVQNLPFIAAFTAGAAGGTKAIAAAATYGAAARVYESRLVRNSLANLARLEPGSTAFERTLAVTQNLITSAAQTARREQEDQ